MQWDQMAFANRVTDALQRMNWTQRDLANALKRSPSTVSGWLNSSSNLPSLQVILKISEVLRVRSCWLAFGDQFEPMTTEEVAAIEMLRLMSANERTAMLSAFKALVVKHWKVGSPPLDADIIPAGTTIRKDRFIPSVTTYEPMQHQDVKKPHHSSAVGEASKAYQKNPGTRANKKKISGAN